MKVLFLNRCPGAFWSIEELFGAIALALPDSVDVTTTVAPQGRASLSSLWRNACWAWRLSGYDVLHQTGDIHYAAIAAWRGRVILTIHDLRFIEEARGLKRLLFWWLWLYLPCLRADRVTVISEFTKSRLFTLCRVNPGKVRVIPNCVAPEFTNQRRPWPVDGIRVLQVGSTDNKNLSRVGEACTGLPVRLCVLGRLTYSQRDLLRRQGVDFESHQDLSKAEVVALYAGCDLVCFVSTYEGFGMPILEAQAVGRPVLTSALSPMREVAGEAAWLVDPFDVAAIRDGLVRLMTDAELREELVIKGFANAAFYSPAAVALQYAEIYSELVKPV